MVAIRLTPTRLRPSFPLHQFAIPSNINYFTNAVTYGYTLKTLPVLKYYRLIAILFLLFTGPAFAQITAFSSIPKSDLDKLLKNGKPADLGHSHYAG